MVPILQLEHITKIFPGVLANDDISLTLHEGEILALLGENGAGKSTLMNILYGLYAPTHGRILIRGQEVAITRPQGAIVRGIGMVHQHFMLVPPPHRHRKCHAGRRTGAPGPFPRPAQRSRPCARDFGCLRAGRGSDR